MDWILGIGLTIACVCVLGLMFGEAEYRSLFSGIALMAIGGSGVLYLLFNPPYIPSPPRGYEFTCVESPIKEHPELQVFTCAKWL